LKRSYAIVLFLLYLLALPVLVVLFAFVRLTNSSDGLFDDTDVHLQKMILE
jgi:hypothetical protein